MANMRGLFEKIKKSYEGRSMRTTFVIANKGRKNHPNDGVVFLTAVKLMVRNVPSVTWCSDENAAYVFDRKKDADMVSLLVRDLKEEDVIEVLPRHRLAHRHLVVKG